MHGLAGDFGTISITDLLLYLANKRLSGTLYCEGKRGKKSIALSEGDVISTASNDPREYLGQFLINFGQLTEEQLTRAFQLQAETKQMLGQILIKAGVVSEEMIRSIFAVKTRESTLALMLWKDGTFRFSRDLLPEKSDDLGTQVSLLQLLEEAEYREREWAKYRQVFPIARLSLAIDESLAPAEFAEGSIDARLFSLMREGHTIEEISLSLHAVDFHLYQRLYALYEEQVIIPIPVTALRTTPVPIRMPSDQEDPTPETMATRARELLAAGKAEEAERLAAHAAEQSPSATVLSALREAEAALLASLRARFITTPRTPILSSPDNAPQAANLSAQERYLLSRVDGARTVEAIARVSPMREIETLKIFKKLEARGLIRLR